MSGKEARPPSPQPLAMGRSQSAPDETFPRSNRPSKTSTRDGDDRLRRSDGLGSPPKRPPPSRIHRSYSNPPGTDVITRRYDPPRSASATNLRKMREREALAAAIELDAQGVLHPPEILNLASRKLTVEHLNLPVEVSPAKPAIAGLVRVKLASSVKKRYCLAVNSALHIFKSQQKREDWQAKRPGASPPTYFPFAGSAITDINRDKLALTLISPETGQTLVLKLGSTEEFESWLAKLKYITDTAHASFNRRHKFPRHPILSERQENDLYRFLPNVKLATDFASKWYSFHGPDAAEALVTYEGAMAARTISTYPWRAAPPPGQRDGDPICDQFCVSCRPGCAVAALADGCGWGPHAARAARAAATAFTAFFLEHAPMQTRSLHGMASLALRAFNMAHSAILEEHEGEPERCGQTTLSAGALMKLRLINGVGRFVYVAVCLGDCKIYRLSRATESVSDVTPAKRADPTNARDPGGRMGPYLTVGGQPRLPDTRNLAVCTVACEEGDLILVCSDGVHDNLDAQNLGCEPSVFGLEAATWPDAVKTDPDRAGAALEEFQCRALAALAFGAPRGPDGRLQPAVIVQTLLGISKAVTQHSRVFMEENSEKLPTDYARYPGKLDHTTAICLAVGDSPPPPAVLPENPAEIRALLADAVDRLRTFYRVTYGAELPASLPDLAPDNFDSPARPTLTIYVPDSPSSSPQLPGLLNNPAADREEKTAAYEAFLNTPSMFSEEPDLEAKRLRLNSDKIRRKASKPGEAPSPSPVPSPAPSPSPVPSPVSSPSPAVPNGLTSSSGPAGGHGLPQAAAWAMSQFRDEDLDDFYYEEEEDDAQVGAVLTFSRSRSVPGL